MAKGDSILERMTEHFVKTGTQVQIRHVNNGYSIIHESGEPIARFRIEAVDPDRFEILWWSNRDRWDRIGDFGGVFMGLEQALDYVSSDPMDIFWKWRPISVNPPGLTRSKWRFLASFLRLFRSSRNTIRN